MDGASWSAIIAAVVLVLTIGGTFWRASSDLTKEITKTNVKLDVNSLELTKISAENDILRENFSNYKVQAAKEFASIEGLYEVRREIQTGFRDIQLRLDGMFLPQRNA